MDVRTQMRNAARYNAAREAIVAGGRRLTFAEAWDRGVRMANGLLALGLEPQDRVAVLEDNTLESSDFFLGAAIANLVRVPLYPRNARESHVHMLGHTGCRAVVVSDKYAAEIDAVRGELPDLEHILVRDSDYEAWLTGQSDVDPDPVIDSQDYFIIRHTGGTTGKSKGVAYTHQAWLAAGRDWFYLYPPVEPGDSCLHLAPISHGSGYLFTPIWLGGGRNVMAEKFDPASLLDLMQEERTAYMFMVPTILNAINRIPGIEQRRFPDLKCMLVTAAPISDETALKAHEIFGDAMYQGYGQTEVLPVAMMGSRQWFAKDVPGSEPLRACGMPLPFAQLQIWDEDDKPVAPGEIGEIVAKTEGQMQGFWNNPQATAERIVEGWVKTGDIGRLDANGYLYMLDRADDMVISGGINIYPAELENVIAAHPAVIEVAVFGIPDPRWGETPCAVVCVERGASVTEQELVDLCSVHLGNYKRPGKIVIRHDPLPKTPVGKIKRKELREPFWAGHARRVARQLTEARCRVRLNESRASLIHRRQRVLCDRCATRVVGVAKKKQAGGAMRSNIAKKQLESKPTSVASRPPYRIEEQIGYLLRRAHQRASSIFQGGIGDPNITPTQYSSMVKLDEYKELSQNLLGRLVGMDKATMQGVVRRLKDRGLVNFRPDPGDARRTLLSLTTEGGRLVAKLLMNGPAVSRETLKPLTQQEQRQLLDLLSKIV